MIGEPPEGGCDLRDILWEEGERPNQPWPCYSWRDDNRNPHQFQYEAWNWNAIKRTDELGEKLESEELMEEEEELNELLTEEGDE